MYEGAQRMLKAGFTSFKFKFQPRECAVQLSANWDGGVCCAQHCTCTNMLVSLASGIWYDILIMSHPYDLEHLTDLCRVGTVHLYLMREPSVQNWGHLVRCSY